MHELVVRNARIIDGSGSPEFLGDLAVSDGRITNVGKVDGQTQRELDADGQLLLPGWVDIHTHYDGQATWDPEMTPSSWHGVTTAVFGNCGVGFAPVRKGTVPHQFNGGSGRYSWDCSRRRNRLLMAKLPRVP
ncbi:MAG: amidohydrolase family protein [Acidimicrobiales bacterium]